MGAGLRPTGGRFARRPGARMVGPAILVCDTRRGRRSWGPTARRVVAPYRVAPSVGADVLIGPRAATQGRPCENFGPFLPVGADLCVRPRFGRTHRCAPTWRRGQAPTLHGTFMVRFSQRLTTSAGTKARARRVAAHAKRLPPPRGKLSAARLTDEGDHGGYGWFSLRPLIRHLLRKCHLPPCGGKALGARCAPLRKFRSVSARRGGPVCPPPFWAHT